MGMSTQESKSKQLAEYGFIADCYCGMCKPNRDRWLKANSISVIHEVKPETEMQTPYEILAVQDTPNANGDGGSTTTVVLAPELVLATGPQIARDMAIRQLPEEAAKDLTKIRVFVREFQTNVPARW